ncbi:MAG TPA: hypothetical protein VGP09_16050, partial [Caballeronia sp.]|nr:hypothetical protein [Caballeronia sp.]
RAKAYSRNANAARPAQVGALSHCLEPLLGAIAFDCLILLAACGSSPGYSGMSKPAEVESNFRSISFLSTADLSGL